jgi:hypothetical protein
MNRSYYRNKNLATLAATQQFHGIKNVILLESIEKLFLLIV